MLSDVYIPCSSTFHAHQRALYLPWCQHTLLERAGMLYAVYATYKACYNRKSYCVNLKTRLYCLLVMEGAIHQDQVQNFVHTH